MYLGWFDDNAKKDAATKIAEAIQAYQARFGTAPNIVLVNERFPRAGAVRGGGVKACQATPKGVGAFLRAGVVSFPRVALFEGAE